MKMGSDEFLRWDNKAITLLGMSGVGKTTLANKLPKERWFHYSGDFRIGTRYMGEAIIDNVKKKAMQVPFLRDLLRSDSIYINNNITTHNLDPLSTFLGKVGDPEFDGLSAEEFRKRQRLHREAEIAAMNDVPDFIEKGQQIYGYPHFINDAGGSLCELGDDGVMDTLAEHTLIIYIRATRDMEAQLIERQRANPKPLYYQEELLDRQLNEYLREQKFSSIEQIEPDKFVRWMFPKLVAHRRPLYQSLADTWGYTVEAHEVEKVRDEYEFLELVADILRRHKEAAA